MSAIAAILGFGPAPLAEQAGEAMMQTLERYPADYSHTLQQDSLFMGCLGQRITPESAHERLPLASGGIVITADAILDNRTQLFDLLEIERPLRSSMTDSELIVRAYRRWDKRTPNYLIGDFAFLIWDERARTLFGARDVFGNRTLYYHRNAERIAFCTAIAPLFALPGVQRAVNPMWLAEFLSIPVMFESSDSASTAYESIEQLPPAHSFTLVNGAMRLERHGNLMPEEQLRLGSDGEYEEAFRDVFSQAVKSKLRTSRPVGSMLSGGLDSGAVSAFAARELALQGRPLKAFSYIPEPEFVDWTHRGRAADERPFIQATARYSGNIEEHYLDFAGKSPLTELDDWLDMLEMP
jgi:asparagine synthase (glutamine-hydrolysing)